MSQIKITDTWLREKVSIVDKFLLEKLEAQEIPEHQFSKRFERKMKKLIRAERHSENYRKVMAFGKKAAVFFAVLLFSGFAVTMSVEANRHKLVEVIETVYSTHILQNFIVSDEAGAFVAKEASYIPDGYELIERTIGKNYTEYLYKDSAGKRIRLNSDLLNGSTAIAIDSKHIVDTGITIKGNEIKMVERKNGQIVVIWTEGNISYRLNTDILPADEVIKIADSLKAIEK